MKKSHIIVIVIVCISLLVGGFTIWMNHNGDASSENVELTKVQKLITKDLNKNITNIQYNLLNLDKIGYTSG